MTNEQKLYIHTDYIWHLVILRTTIMAPFVLVKGVSDVIANVADKVYWKLDKVLPRSYKSYLTKFENLSKSEQRAVEKLAKARGAILSQVQDTLE